MARRTNYRSPARVVARALADISIVPVDYAVTAVHFDVRTACFFVEVRAEYGVFSLLVSRTCEYGHAFESWENTVSVCFRTGSIFNAGPGLHLPAPPRVAKLAIRAAGAIDLFRDFENHDGGRRWVRKPPEPVIEFGPEFAAPDFGLRS